MLLLENSRFFHLKKKNLSISIKKERPAIRPAILPHEKHEHKNYIKRTNNCATNFKPEER